MQYFIETFGAVTIGKAAAVIAALIFVYMCYGKVKEYFREKTLREKEKDDRIQRVIDQAQNYPKWHQQSIDIREELSREITKLSRKIDEVNVHLEEMKVEEKEKEATSCRYRILRFDDEIRHDERHTKEHFDQILDDIKAYEDYCKNHEEYSNNKAVLAIRNIERVYEKCALEGTFL